MREILDFCKNQEEIVIPDNGILIEEGKTTGALFILIEGEIEVFTNGKSVAVLTEPGMIIGEISLLKDSPHTATCKAVGETKVHFIINGREFLLSNPDIFWLISRDIANKLEVTTKCLATFASDMKKYSQFELNRQLELANEIIGSTSM